MHACIRKHNDAMKTIEDPSLEKYSSHFIERVVCERELETEQRLQHIDPRTLMAITAFLSRSPGLLNQGPGGPASLGHGSHSSIFTPTATAQSGVLRAPSAVCWFSLQHLISNCNCSIRGPEGPLLGAGSLYSVLPPTDLNFLSPGLYDNLTSTLLPESVTISHSIQPIDSQGHILIFLDRMHQLFTQVHFFF